MLISVVVPTWNALDHLINLVESWIRVGSKHANLIIVDDESNDQSLSYLAGHRGVSGLRVLRQDHGGPGRARNLGLAVVETPFVTFADVDDQVHWRALFEVARVMQAECDLDVVTAGVGQSDSKLPELRVSRSSTWTRLKFLSTGMTVWGRVYRSAMLRELSPVFPETRAAEDVLASVRIASASRLIATTPFGFYSHKPNLAGLTKGPDYATQAEETMALLQIAQVERSLKAYALAASAKYFAGRGAWGPAIRTAARSTAAVLAPKRSRRPGNREGRGSAVS